jgi:hypothetical protein
MVTDLELEKAGYKKYGSNGITYPYSDFFYQKKVVDERGVKYFIAFVHYSHDAQLTESWMVGFNQNEPLHLRFDIHSHVSIDVAEFMCEKFWVTMCNSTYYEKYHIGDANKTVEETK